MVYIYGGAGTTDKNDWELMHSTMLDDEQNEKAKQRKREKAITSAYKNMEQALVNKEILDGEWQQKYKDFRPLDFIIAPDAHVAKEVRYELEKTDKRIAYYKGKAKNDEGQEADPEEVKNAMDAWFEYMMKLHSREERLQHYNQKYGMKLTLGHVLGWKRNPWD